MTIMGKFYSKVKEKLRNDSGKKNTPRTPECIYIHHTRSY